MDTFDALSEPIRRKILETLAREGQLTATEISGRFAVSPSAISQHLKVLREAKLVYVEKRAQRRIYRINPDAMLEVQNWASQLAQTWERRFNSLDALLKSEKDRTEKER